MSKKTKRAEKADRGRLVSQDYLLALIHESLKNGNLSLAQIMAMAAIVNPSRAFTVHKGCIYEQLKDGEP